MEFTDLKHELRNIGFDASRDKDWVYVTNVVNEEESYTVAYISNKHMYYLTFDEGEYIEYLDGKIRGKLFDILVRYANTPLKYRK